MLGIDVRNLHVHFLILLKVDFRVFKERIIHYLCETMTDWCPVVQNDSLQETDYTGTIILWTKCLFDFIYCIHFVIHAFA